MKKVAKVKQPLVKPKENLESQPQNLPSQYAGNNASLIDFVAKEFKSNKDEEFVEVVENSGLNQIKLNETETKQSGFSFINQKKPSSQVGSSLIDLDSYESQKSNQIKQLTENISNVYNNISEESMKSGQNRMNNMNMSHLNQPNINISNTFYNLGELNNYNIRGPYNPSSFNNMGMNMQGNGYNQGFGMNNQGYSNMGCGIQNSIGVGMPNMQNMSNMQNSSNWSNRPNMNNNPYSLKDPISQSNFQNISKPIINPIQTNETFNYEYYNNLKNTQSSISSSTNSGAYSSRKKEEDPFKSLLSLK